MRDFRMSIAAAFMPFWRLHGIVSDVSHYPFSASQSLVPRSTKTGALLFPSSPTAPRWRCIVILAGSGSAVFGHPGRGLEAPVPQPEV